MKQGIHPEYKEIAFKCACGAEIPTRSTTNKPGVAICSSCHPFFTGKQKFVDTAGRVEKFMRKYSPKAETEADKKATKKK
ncbi:MAG: 50S ribosomal protein L31 [Deferribacteraceae bacterium]|jgi:large subunit ribosomal protein L31|nr:50S ribosomal protein L31 [Deferribacteraceae bacterium]